MFDHPRLRIGTIKHSDIGATITVANNGLDLLDKPLCLAFVRNQLLDSYRLAFARVGHREGFFSKACFLCQQAGEKALKAVAYGDGLAERPTLSEGALAEAVERSVALRVRRRATLRSPEFDPSLPIVAHRDTISEAVSKHPVVIVCGETGSIVSLFAFEIIAGATYPGLFAIPQIIAGAEATGRWVGLQNAAGNVAGLIAPAVTGYLVYQTGHFDLAFVLVAALNLVGAIVALAMLTIAARPADEDHLYGHSKAEYISSGVEGTLILLAASLATAAAVSFEAWILPAENETGRILDKLTPGVNDGFLFDAHLGLSLRVIAGNRQRDVPGALKPGVWQHVAVVVSVLAASPSDVRRCQVQGALTHSIEMTSE